MDARTAHDSYPHMSLKTLITVMRAHLDGRNLQVHDRRGRPLDPMSEAFALHEMAEGALGALGVARDEWAPDAVTLEMPRALLVSLRAGARAA
jgi:hypothetical protein